ncbi:hypothetical protein HYY74_04960 [Candidatus Woesearchaeota archaeon]|nr:hypothetical protein [Candidatus Woesearchaeota archaeon]
MRRQLTMVICIMLLSTPFTSMLASGQEQAPGEEQAQGSCTVQERINWICRQGKDSPISCTDEWASPRWSEELNALVMLREEKGGDKTLESISYKGDDFCTKGANSGKCTIQQRINWICAQSKEDQHWSCAAEYKTPQFAEELNKLAALRAKLGGHATLEKAGYDKLTCPDQAPAQPVQTTPSTPAAAPSQAVTPSPAATPSQPSEPGQPNPPPVQAPPAETPPVASQPAPPAANPPAANPPATTPSPPYAQANCYGKPKDSAVCTGENSFNICDGQGGKIRAEDGSQVFYCNPGQKCIQDSESSPAKCVQLPDCEGRKRGAYCTGDREFIICDGSGGMVLDADSKASKAVYTCNTGEACKHAKSGEPAECMPSAGIPDDCKPLPIPSSGEPLQPQNLPSTGEPAKAEPIPPTNCPSPEQIPEGRPEGDSTMFTHTAANGKTYEVEVKNGLVVHCLENKQEVECPFMLPKSDDELRAIISGASASAATGGLQATAAASVKVASLGDDKQSQVYGLANLVKYTVESSYKAGGTGLLMLELVNDNGETEHIISFEEITFDSSGKYSRQDSFSTAYSEGKYHFRAALFNSEGALVGTDIYKSGGVVADIFLLKPVSEAPQVSDYDLAKKLKEYLDVRVKASQNSPEYRRAFREFMTMYIQRTFSDPQDAEAAGRLLEDANIDSTIRHMESSLKEEIQAYYIEYGLKLSDVAYEETKPLADEIGQFKFGLNLLNPFEVFAGAYNGMSGLNGRWKQSAEKNMKELADIRATFLYFSNEMSKEKSFDSAYSSIISAGDIGENSKYYRSLTQYDASQYIFKGIKENDQAEVIYRMGSLPVYYSLLIFYHKDTTPQTSSDIEKYGPYQFSDINERRRNIIQIGIDQYRGLGYIAPNTKQHLDAQNNVAKFKELGNYLGTAEGAILIGGVAVTLVGSIAAAPAIARAAAAGLTKLGSFGSRISAMASFAASRIPGGGQNLLMFSWVTIEGASTVGGCIDFFEHQAGRESQAGGEISKCYARAAAALFATGYTARLSWESVKPFMDGVFDKIVKRGINNARGSAGTTGGAGGAAGRGTGSTGPSTGASGGGASAGRGSSFRPPSPPPRPDFSARDAMRKNWADKMDTRNIPDQLWNEISALRAYNRGSGTIEGLTGTRSGTAAQKMVALRRWEQQLNRDLAQYPDDPILLEAKQQLDAAIRRVQAQGAQGSSARPRAETPPQRVIISDMRNDVFSMSTQNGKAAGVVTKFGRGHGDGDSILAETKGASANLVVADGASGMGREEASAASSAVVKHLSGLPDGADLEALESAIISADRRVKGVGQTTVVAATINGNRLSIAWVGDSEYILIRNGRIVSHNFNELHGTGNILDYALGGGLPLEGIPGRTITLQKDDILILGSDGIFGPIAETPVIGPRSLGKAAFGPRNFNDYNRILQEISRARAKTPEEIRNVMLRLASSGGDDASLIVYVQGG